MLGEDAEQEKSSGVADSLPNIDKMTKTGSTKNIKDKKEKNTRKSDDLRGAIDWVRVAEIVTFLKRPSLQQSVPSGEGGGGDKRSQSLTHVVVGGLDKSHCFLGARRGRARKR